MADLNDNEKSTASQEPNSGAENDLEDTKPRRIRNTPAEEPQLTEDYLANTTPVPVESSIEYNDETRPVAISDTPIGEPEALPAADPEDANLNLISVPASGEEPTAPVLDEVPPGFEHTIPPPVSISAGAAVYASAVDTASTTSQASEQPSPAKPLRKKKSGGSKSRRAKRRRWLLIPAIGLLAILLITAASAFGGYASGIEMRRDAERTQVLYAVDQQYQLGLQDMAEGNFFRARQRFEYVIQLNPNYPGVTDKLAETLLYLNATATPTLQPTPTVTPTPDMRANEELLNQARQAIIDSSWDSAVESLLALRQKDANFHAIEIDGMLFLALRNRGKEKIVNTNLEGGIYDLTLAANFAPLDSEAKGLLNWSQMYITGASFWEIDWAQVVDYFSQVAPQMPNLMDSSRMTASERYRLGLYNYGNQLAQQGSFCRAVELYAQSLQIIQDPEVQSAWEQAVKGCEGGNPGGGQETPKPGKKTKTPEPLPPVP